MYNRGARVRTLGTLSESLPEDTTPPLAGSIDEIDALNLPPVLSGKGLRQDVGQNLLTIDRHEPVGQSPQPTGY
jgi:hypothetical protein